MFDNTGLPPEEFIREVLRRHYAEHTSADALAVFYGVSPLLIRRIITHYELTVEKNMSMYPDRQGEKRSVKKVGELRDELRRIGGKITQEDLDDMLMDLKLFEKGRELPDPDTKKGE